LGNTVKHLTGWPSAETVNHRREYGSSSLAQNNAPKKSKKAKTGMNLVHGRKKAQEAQNSLSRPSDGRGFEGEGIFPAPSE